MTMKVVLAYSGGLDTSIAIPWLKERYDAQVVAVTVNLGGEKDSGDVHERALAAGAIKAMTVDGKEAFVRHFVFPALQAGAIYQGQYPLATALGRPLIARYLVEVAQRESAQAVAHGCTGKGNDQVRFDLGITTLDPSLRIIAPAREWSMTREEEIQYAHSRQVPLRLGQRSPYSTDENLWGRSIEAGNLEDPWQEPPEEAFAWTRSPEKAPQTPLYLEISFDQGLPQALDGEEMGGVALIQHLNNMAGEHGVGRIDHLEDRLVGIKSREVYEAPAAVVLHAAHKALESITLSRDQLRFKERVAREYAELVYNGLWYTGFHQDLDAYVRSTQRYVTGTVRLKLFKGSCTVVGRSSPYSLYQHDLATYDKGDRFDHRASVGFIHIYGLPGRTQARLQPLDLPDLGGNG
ncbi:MAG: argG [Dehalococcoidia bacterium]|nr:argG [Dehalococcoidia bacterium]